LFYQETIAFPLGIVSEHSQMYDPNKNLAAYFFLQRFYWFDCQNLEPTQSLPQVPSKQLWDGVNNFDHFFREFGG